MGLALVHFQKYWLLIDLYVHNYLMQVHAIFLDFQYRNYYSIRYVQKLKRQQIKVIGTNTYGIYKFSHTKKVKQKKEHL